MLAKLEVRRPKQSSLRRSISTSYYALFHGITLEWSRCFVSPVAIYSRRMIAHRDAKDAAERLSDTNTRDKRLKHLSGMPQCPLPLQKVSTDFVALQERRHIADYDLSINLQRNDALEMHTRAERSIKSLIKCRTDCPSELQAYIMSLLKVRVS